MWIFWSEIFYGGHDSQKGGHKHTIWAERAIGQRDTRKVAMIARCTEQKLYQHQNIVMIAHSA